MCQESGSTKYCADGETTKRASGLILTPIMASVASSSLDFTLKEAHVKCQENSKPV